MAAMAPATISWVRSTSVDNSDRQSEIVDFELNLHADFDGPVAKLSAKPLNRFARYWI